MRNYYPDVNRFKLAGPPVWFLRQLWDFDPSLVIVPSRQGFYYRLSQRRKLQLSEKIVQEALWQQSDTQMLASYGLVPVTTIVATANWGNPYIFVELTNRSPHRLGGAEKVNKMLDEQEHTEDLQQKVKTDEHLTYLGKDGWQLYRKKIGLGRSYSTERSGPSLPRPTGKVAHRQLFGPG